MSRVFAIALGVASLCLPAAALAQDGGSGGSGDVMIGSPGPDGARAQIGDGWNAGRGDYWGNILREDMERDLNLRAANDRKVALAQRVGVLVDQGQCDVAETLARSERDHMMARTVRRICEPGVGLKSRYR